MIRYKVDLSKKIKHLGIILDEHLDKLKYVNNLVPRLIRTVRFFTIFIYQKSDVMLLKLFLKIYISPSSMVIWFMRVKQIQVSETKLSES